MCVLGGGVRRYSERNGRQLTEDRGEKHTKLIKMVATAEEGRVQSSP